MKKILIASFVLLAFSLPQTSYAGGCTLTKTLYDQGKYKRAFKLAKTYANYKDACAEYYLGLMYLYGKGVKADTDKGNSYMQSAADKDYQPAIDFFASQIP